MRAPKRDEEAGKSKGLSTELAEEKAMNALLASELEQSRKENEALKAIMHARDNRSPVSSGMDFDGPTGFCSTRRMAPNPSASHGMEESRFLTSMNHLSLASINVPECSAPDGEDIHRQTFEQWKDLLSDSLRLAGVEDEATMFTVFKVKAGLRLLGIFRNTKSSTESPDPEALPFSNAMHRLGSYFGSGSDVMLMRRRLALMIQTPEESDLTFITRVGTMARLCEFDEEKEIEEIVATVAEHARSREVRVIALKMLSRKGTFTDLVDKVREHEAIRLNEEYVKQKLGKQTPAVIASLSSSSGSRQYRQFDDSRGAPYQRNFPNRRGGGRASRGKQQYAARASREQDRERCWRCYSVFHSAQDCKAKDQLCNKCGTVGHYQRACPKRGPNASRTPLRRREMDHSDEPPYKISFVDKAEEPKKEEDSVSVDASGE